MAITATVNSTYAHVAVFVQFPGLTGSVFASVERVYSDGSSTPVRGGDTGELTVGELLLYDTEVGFDTPVSYRATAFPLDDPTVTVTSGVVTLASDGGVWVKDPLRPWASLRFDLSPMFTPACQPIGVDICFTGFGDEAMGADATLSDVLGDPFPADTYARRKAPTTSFTFSSRSLDAIQQVRDLFTEGGVLLLQAPAAYGWPDRYVQPGDVAMARLGADQRKPWRSWSVPLTLTRRPAPADPAQGVPQATWCDIADDYGTSHVLEMTGATWLDVAGGTVPLPVSGYGSGRYGDGPYGG